MKKIKVAVFSLFLASIFFGGCQTNNPGNSQHLKKAAWVNPRKGKIFEKYHNDGPALTLSEQHILGHVNTVVKKYYAVNDSSSSVFKDSIFKYLIDTQYTGFNEDGYMVEKNVYKSQGPTQFNCFKSVYKYDAKKNLIEFDLEQNDTPVVTLYSYQFDDKGNKTLQLDSQQNSRSNKITFNYDEKGQETAVYHYYPNGGSGWVDSFQYDPAGNQIAYYEIPKMGGERRKFTATYDALHNQTEYSELGNDTIRGIAMKMKYDENGNCVEYDGYDNRNKLKYKAAITYDQMGNEVDRVVYHPDLTVDQTRSGYHEYKYDDYGNITRDIYFYIKGGRRRAGSIREFTYRYY